MPPYAPKSPPTKPRRVHATAELLVQRLSRLRRLAFDIEIEAIDDLELGDFADSALRGGWFAALKDLGCVVDHRQCDECSLVATCSIPAIQGEVADPDRFFARPFRLRLDSGAYQPVEALDRRSPGCGARELRQTSSACLSIDMPPMSSSLTRSSLGLGARPSSSTGCYSIGRGESLHFGIDLFAAALPYAALALSGIERLANRGLGRRRGRFAVKSVTRREEAGWRDEFARRLDEIPRQRLAIVLETPLRLLDRGRPLREFSFDRLVSNLLRRATGLVESWGDIDCRELVERARSIDVRQTQYTRADCVRFSSRQQRAMNLMGHVGEIEIAGDLEPFLPLLAFGEAVGAGKGTTFGLGCIRLKPATAAERSS